MFCQEHTKSNLQCPARTTKTSAVGYKTLQDQLVQFEKFGHVPMDLDIKSLDDGNGIEAMMIKHRACWHTSCPLKFNETKIDRVERRSHMKKVAVCQVVFKSALIMMLLIFRLHVSVMSLPALWDSTNPVRMISTQRSVSVHLNLMTLLSWLSLSLGISLP